jgi:hypothetical protein
LAIFPPDISRPLVSELVGRETEELIHLFCVINRQKVVIDGLLNKFPESVLRSTTPVDLVPKEGIVTEHIRTKEKIRLSRKTIAQFIFLTMSDYQDQFYNWWV